MKTSKKSNVTATVFILLIAIVLSNCSSDDGSDTPETQELSCEVSGIIDSNLVDTWTGEIFFNSNNTWYSQTHNFRENGTVLTTSTTVPDLNGCWRVSGENIKYIGTINYNGSSETVSFNGRIVTQDSIYGTYTSSNAESGTIWMVR